jgi:hypothetical protein
MLIFSPFRKGQSHKNYKKRRKTQINISDSLKNNLVIMLSILENYRFLPAIYQINFIAILGDPIFSEIDFNNVQEYAGKKLLHILWLITYLDLSK